MSVGQANTCQSPRFLDFFLSFLLRIHQNRVKKNSKKTDAKNLWSCHFICDDDPQTGAILLKNNCPPLQTTKGGQVFLRGGKDLKMDEKLKKELMKGMRPPKLCRRVYIGNRGGVPVYLPMARDGYKKLCKKYPGGVVPEWKVHLLRIFRPGWKNSPWFSDVLTGICKRILGE